MLESSGVYNTISTTLFSVDPFFLKKQVGGIEHV